MWDYKTACKIPSYSEISDDIDVPKLLCQHQVPLRSPLNYQGRNLQLPNRDQMER